MNSYISLYINPYGAVINGAIGNGVNYNGAIGNGAIGNGVMGNGYNPLLSNYQARYAYLYGPNSYLAPPLVSYNPYIYPNVPYMGSYFGSYAGYFYPYL